MKHILLLICLAVAVTAQAQEKIVIKETFENNRLNWDEYYEKDYSCSLNDGYLELKSSKDDYTIWNITELPINMNDNFKITAKFTVPKLNDKYFFGILYNYEDGNNNSSFEVSEKRFILYNKVNGTKNINRQNTIILTAGKNKSVVIQMERRGGKLIFSVDDMEAVTITQELKFATFGFVVNGANTIMVDEVTIESYVRED